MRFQVVQRETPSEGQDATVLSIAKAALQAQSAALARVASGLDGEFCRALDLLSQCQGRVVVTGIGKSGLIGRKIAATFACSGRPSVFVHAADAAHGDLGMITPSDVVLLVSHSGATEELVCLLPYFEELEVPIIALVGRSGSPLARAADVALYTHVEREICPHNVVVTTSALVTLALADALALALMRQSKIGTADLSRRHPRGSLGRLLSPVRDVMQRRLPLVTPERSLREGLVTLVSGRLGLLIVADEVGVVLGIVGEAELREAFEREQSALDLTVASVMTSDPVTIREDATLQAAGEKMQRLSLDALIVVDARQRVSGIVRRADL